MNKYISNNRDNKYWLLAPLAMLVFSETAVIDNVYADQSPLNTQKQVEQPALFGNQLAKLPVKALVGQSVASRQVVINGATGQEIKNHFQLNKSASVANNGVITLTPDQ